MTPLAAIAEMLRARIGLDPGALGERTLAHAVRARSRARGLSDAAAYLAAVRDDPAEWEALVESMVVSETWFFRDREPFMLLARRAAQMWARRGARDPVAVLSLPCATGEEAWSIAIALAAAGLPPAAFRVDAVDLSARALAIARAGLYAPRALRRQRLDPAWASYLQPTADGQLAVAPALHASVHFTHGNLLAAAALFPGRRFDCVFSRNLLIYCAAPVRAAAIDSFAALLRPDGLLVLGHAETLPPRTPGFVRESPPGAFAWRRLEMVAAKSADGAGGRPGRAPRAPERVRARRSPPLPRAGARAERRNGHDDPLGRARALADRGRLAEAATLLAARLGTSPGDAAAHALFGIVRAAQGRDDDAVGHLRRALYLDPTHEAALAHLAALLEQRGERAAAARLRARTARLEGAR